MNRRQLLKKAAALGLAPIALSGLARLGGDLAAPAQASTSAARIYPKLVKGGISLGAYDPYGDFSSYAGDTIEHLFLPWQDVELSSLYQADAYALARRRSLLITIEPWSWSGDWRLTNRQLRDAVLGGRYDSTIVSIAGLIGEMKSEVTIRWGQEMDNTSGRFSWGGWEPDDYIRAYRHFVDLTRQHAPRARFMWSPKGEKALVDYYPSDEYVDEVGLSVFGLQKYDRDKFGRNLTFADHLAPGYQYASRFGKPIVVAELGYSGDIGYVTDWADSVTLKDPRFPLLTGVSYFNDKEVHPWPQPYGLPDWRIGHSVTS